MLGLILNGGERKVAQSLLTQIAMRQLTAKLFITFIHLLIPDIPFVQGSLFCSRKRMATQNKKT